MPYQDKQGRMCGFLNIEETESSGSFCRRYFVLDQINSKLVYYMDSPANLPEAWKSPVGEINIHNISKVSDGLKLRPKVKFCFTVTVAGRQYFLQAEQDPDKFQWMEAITNASKITVPESLRSSTQATEWHAAGVEQEAYVTQIAGGVVCKLPVQSADVELDAGSDDESRSSSSGRMSPSSLNRGLSAFTRDMSSSLDHSKADHSKAGATSSTKFIKKGYCVKQGAVDKQPIRTLPIEDVLEARQAADGAHPNRDNLFEVLTSKRIFYIQCDTPDDMHSWIEAVRSAIRQRRLEERKSMQDPSGRQTLEEEMSSGTYPSPIWVRERGSRDAKQQKKNFILW
uniref:PH domain-containing protein n=1 Tax=Arion vulgaris TaxID=1028688 RepID=A0A0B6ZFF0_9EUPU